MWYNIANKMTGKAREDLVQPKEIKGFNYLPNRNDKY
jgi:hypothetical protein